LEDVAGAPTLHRSGRPSRGRSYLPALRRSSEEYYLCERRYGSFQRSFGVPDGVDADKIEANFKNGVLTVTLPKATEVQRSEKKIAIKKA
jgi:HSP20 family molecular chaperone IbpA